MDLGEFLSSLAISLPLSGMVGAVPPEPGGIPMLCLSLRSMVTCLRPGSGFAEGGTMYTSAYNARLTSVPSRDRNANLAILGAVPTKVHKVHKTNNRDKSRVNGVLIQLHCNMEISAQCVKMGPVDGRGYAIQFQCQ